MSEEGTSMLLQIGERMDPAEAFRAPGRIGGIPWLPSRFEAPRSVLTGRPMAFLFQIVFPPDHLLHRYTAAMFMALDAVNEDLVVPPLSCGELSCGPVTPEQLVEQQALHGVYLFERDGLAPRPDLVSPVGHIDSSPTNIPRLVRISAEWDCIPNGFRATKLRAP